MTHEEQFDKLLNDKLEGLHFDYNPDHWAMMQERMNIEGLDANPDAFDMAIQGKLDNITPPELNPLHWEMMQDAMAAEGLTTEVDPIDELIKSRLENITPELNPAHWEMMQDAMAADGMNVEVDSVDELLKGKLENIEYAYNPSHWAALKLKIDEESLADAQQVEDVLFDASAYGQLSNVEIPYNEEHWELMKERIDAEFSIRGKLVRYKVAEVALILMIIITAFHYLPIHKKKMNRTVNIAETTIIQNNLKKDVATSTINNATPQKQNANSSNNTIVSATQKQESNNSARTSSKDEASELIEKNTNAITSNEVIKNNASIAANTVVDNSSAISDQHDIVIAPPSRVINTSITKSEQPISDAIASAIAASINAKDEVLNNNNTINSTTQVEAVQTLQTALLDVKDGGQDAIGCSTCTELKQKWGVSFGMYSTFDLNNVMTPYDNIFDAGSYSQRAFGYGGGFSIGFRYNRWEVETGALYSAKQYAPRPQIEIFSGNLSSGYIGEAINDVELNMIKIPLNLKYHFVNKGKWNIYSVGGANLNMAVHSNYDKKQYFISGNGGIGSFSPLPFGEVAANETIGKKRPADGFFDGGSFLENRYFTANLGVGVERKFSPRWSIFGQPTYQHQLISQGLGPNNDRINTLSILTGARVTF